jgi:MFS family permease
LPQGVIGTILGVNSSRIVANLSWRWFYWIMTIPGALAFVLLFVFLPETKYHRTKDALGMVHQDPATSKSKMWPKPSIVVKFKRECEIFPAILKNICWEF